LVRLIVGAALAEAVSREQRVAGELALRARGLAGGTVGGVDLDLHAGEIVGVAGILGSGREHLAPLLFGALARTAGDVAVGGAPLPAGDPRRAIRAGIAYVPADRHADGAVMTMRVRENLTLPDLRGLTRRGGRLDTPAERREVGAWIQQIGLRPAEPERPLELFSGGNQQKVVLAKWLRNRPRVLLLDEPTQGVDVGAKAAIYELVRDAAAAGTAVLLASSDTAELASVCDRAVVMRDGAAGAELDGGDLTEERLVVEGLGLQAPPAPATTAEVHSND
jgi:ribose transport system ATP-binding protein